MSRQLNTYFTLYLPYLLATDERFQDVYTVFAGGDDLFLIGPWKRMPELALALRRSFGEYTCLNPALTLSAGISVNKPGEPVRAMAEKAESALSLSKTVWKTKDSFTVFDETVTWATFDELERLKERLLEWLADDVVNNAMLFRLNELIEMAKQAKELVASSHPTTVEEMECLKWRARLKYSVVRNVGKKRNKAERSALIDEVLATVGWLETYGGAMRLPLWQVIYNRR